jgi:DNA-binding transcriptional LysR family regulator
MEFNQLRNFLVVAEMLHFSKAAERIHLSQPALSLQIRSLEEELGVKLFERNRQKTALTAAGKVYSEEVGEVLAQMEKTMNRARQAAQGKIGRLRIGFISTAAAHIVPKLVAAFRKTHPEVTLELIHALTAEQITRLEDHRLDIGFFRVPAGGSPALKMTVIHEEPFKLFLPLNHPLARRKQLRLQDLDGEDFLVYARKNAPGFHDFILQRLKESGANPAMINEASDMYTLVSLVSAGVGLAIAPASVEHYGFRDVAVRDVRDMPPSQIALAFRTNLAHPAAEAFIRLTLASHDTDDLAEEAEVSQPALKTRAPKQTVQG